MPQLPKNIKEGLSLLKQEGPSILTQLSLKKIRKEIGHLNAFTFIIPPEEEKKNPKNNGGGRSPPPLPLSGIPIAIKDNFCVQGVPTTCGSKMLHNFIAPYTATVVRKLEEAGGRIVGKTNMDEFGMGNGTIDTIFGPTKNSWGLEQFSLGDGNRNLEDWYVPGGSSGGSAVAVASGACMAALGSDTGGSTRNPASYCGVYGLKPTYGSLSRFGLIPLVNSMDVPGIMTRTVQDCATIYDIIKGWDPQDSTTVETPSESTKPSPDGCVKDLRIGIPKEYGECDGMSQEVKDCWVMVEDLLEKEGALVSEVSLPHTKYSIVCYSVLNPCEVASNMARYDGLRYGHRSVKKGLDSTESLYAQTRHEGFNKVVRGRILTGNYFLLKKNYDKYFLQALKVRRLIQNDFDLLWNSGYELLLTPVTLTTAPKYSEFIKWDNRKQSSVQDYCTQPANMGGLPALSVPIKLSSSSGLPISLQLVGPRFSEKVIFEVAQRIENLVKFRHPS